MSSPDSSEEIDLAGNANNETKIILTVVCLLGMVAIGAEVWFHFSKQDAIEKANALRAQLATQVPVKSAETDQALLQPLDAELVTPAMVPAVTTQQSGMEAGRDAPVAAANTSRMDAKTALLEKPPLKKSTLEKPTARPQTSKSLPNRPRTEPRNVAQKPPAPARITQGRSTAMPAKTVANQPSVPSQATSDSLVNEDESASGLPPVSDRTSVIASAKTGGVKTRGGAETSPSSGRSVWEQLRIDIKTKGGKADLCNDAARSLNQCP